VLELYKTRPVDEGYIQARKLAWDDWFPNIREAIKLLERLNIPLPFLFVYCEPWLLLAKLHPILEELLEGEYYLLPDFWVWYVDPKKKVQDGVFTEIKALGHYLKMGSQKASLYGYL
jgi:hypothetical protein